MKSIKILILCFLVSISGALFALGKINMHVSTQRFLDKNKNTIIHIDYQIPYNNLVFLAQKGGYFAELDVTVDAVQGDSVMFSQAIKDNIGISDKYDAGSEKTYLNRVTFVLNTEPYKFRIRARDVNSKKTDEVTIPAVRLGPEAIVSDLELCSVVRPDSSSYLDKFHRGKTLYKTQPSLIFDKTEYENVYLYFELYTKPEQRNESSLIVLTVEKDSVIVSDDFIDFLPKSDSEGITLKIPLTELAAGKYNGTLDLQMGELTVQQSFVFFVTEPLKEVIYFFPSSDDDYKLLRYFLGSNVPSDWKRYDDQTKRKYITQLWKDLAYSNSMSAQSMLDLVRDRVDYANKFYTHFEPGWTSDMGRIHIRKGKPDEIEKDTSSDETKFVRKDYQIWKYTGKTNAVYLFVDIQMNGNYKLLYVNNDDMETSNPDYLKYLGDDFDTSVLEN